MFPPLNSTVQPGSVSAAELEIQQAALDSGQVPLPDEEDVAGNLLLIAIESAERRGEARGRSMGGNTLSDEQVTIVSYALGEEVQRGNLSDADRKEILGRLALAEPETVTACREHHTALQRIGTALGLLPGANLHRECVPAILALKAARAAEPEGWKLVPIKPTSEMVANAMKECGDIGAGSCGEHAGVDGDDMRSVWEAMLTTAPTSKEAP